MELIFLGTSSGTPSKTRNVLATVCKKTNSKSWCLVDCGEGTQQQLLHVPVSLFHLELITITHVHGDHCYGLPGLLASASMLKRQKPLTIIGPLLIREFVETALRCSATELNFEVKFIDVATLTEPIECNGMTIDATGLSHRVPSYAYSFSEQRQNSTLDTQKVIQAGIPQGKYWKLLQQGKEIVLENGKRFHAKEFVQPPKHSELKIVIAGDNDQPELLSDCVRGAQVLVHESTYTEAVAQRVGPIPQHSYAKQVAIFAERLRVPNLILTHFSPRYHDSSSATHSIMSIEQEARSYYSRNLCMANDFNHYQLRSSGECVLINERQVSGHTE